MLNTIQLKTLKQVNVSKDAEKTKERVKRDFSAASNRVKADIVEMSGQKRSAYYRAFKTGALNARLLLSLSFALNVSPFYYTGEEDSKEPCGVKEVKNFLLAHEYFTLAEELELSKPEPAKRGRKKPAKKDATIDVMPTDAEDAAEPACCGCMDDAPELELDDEDDMIVYEFAFPFPDDEKFKKAMDALTEDDAVLLLKSLFRRAEAGGDAEEYAELVKRCLLL